MAGQSIPRWMWATLDDIPLAPPPQGVIPNFDHPKLLRYHSLTISCCCCLFFLVLFSAARLYTKICILRKTTADDYFFWVTLPLILVVLILNIYLDNAGMYGYHEWERKIKNITKPILVVTFLEQACLPATVWFVKSTILFLILNAFKTVRWLRILCWMGIVVTFVFYAVKVAIQIQLCRPRGGQDRTSWVMGLLSPQCAGSNSTMQKMSVITGFFGVFSDLYILVIPMPAVANLHIDKRKKLGVFLIFSSGILACIASILALYFRIRLFSSKDLLVDGIPGLATHMVELTVGLVITCIPSITKLGRHIRNKRNQSRGGNIANSPGDTAARQLSPQRNDAPDGIYELDSRKTSAATIKTTVSNHFASTDQIIMIRYAPTHSQLSRIKASDLDSTMH